MKRINIFKLLKVSLGLSTILLSQLQVNAQALPTYELDFSAIVPPAGPNTNPITIPFSLDELNDNTYTPPSAGGPSITYSLRNQVFTNLTYSNLADGLTFGGGATLSTGGIVQASAVNVPYDLLGAYTSNGGPKSDMFTTNPEASGAQLGTGMDVDGNLFSNNLNGGTMLFTAAQVLFNNNTPKTARVYFGDLVITFDRPVKNPVLHFAGMGGSYSFLPFGLPDVDTNYISTFFATELEMESTGLTSTLLSSNATSAGGTGQGLVLSGNDLLNNFAKPNGNSFDITGEYPINNFGASTGSVRINGTVQEIVYRVYLRGADSSDFAWSAYGLDPVTGSQLITSATRNPFTGDIWWAAASFMKPTQQISGNVFIDPNGLEDNDITKTLTVDNAKTNINDSLYANLINAAGTVVATQPISDEGIYLFDSVAVGTYTVELSATPGIIGSLPPAATLPSDWVSTGENNGLAATSDGNIDSKSAPVVVAAEEIVTNVNFGIERIPNSDDKTQTIPTPVGGVIPQSTATNAVSGTDPEDGVLGNPETIVVKSLPTNGTVSYNGNPMAIGQVITGFNPGLLAYSGITNGSSSITFDYSFVDKAMIEDPTPAFYTLNWTTPLDIFSIQLAGVVKEKTNNLDWKLVGNEKDLSKQELYRSENGSASKLIATLPINGNKYTYTDEAINLSQNTTYQYIVKGIDKSGAISQSNTVVLKRVITDGVVLFPNPVKTTFTLQFDRETSSASIVDITDAEGKLVQSIEIESGVENQLIDISTYAAGIYNVRVENEQMGSKVIQIIKK